MFNAHDLMMFENHVELGESLFSHRKSKIQLLKQTVVTVSCRDEACRHASDNTVPDPAHRLCRPWLPRARSLLFSLHVYFTHDVALAPAVSPDIDLFVADLIESAELWGQLGYEISEVHRHDFGHDQAERALILDFELQSQQRYDSQLWCPDGIVECSLKTVSLSLHFRAEGCSKKNSDISPSIDDLEHQQLTGSQRSCHSYEAFSQRQSNTTEAESVQDHQQYVSASHSNVQLPDAGCDSCPTIRRPAQVLLDEVVLSALVDAGFRSSICSTPIHLAAGVKKFTDQDICRLAELAPAIFVPNHVRRLGEQASFIPGISRLLSKFLNTAQPTPSSPLEPSWSKPVDLLDIQKCLWDTLRCGIRSDGSARRLSPLRASEGTRVTDQISDFSHLRKFPYQAEDTDQEQRLRQALEDEPLKGEDLFNFVVDLDDQAEMPWEAILKSTAQEMSRDHTLAECGLRDVGIQNEQALVDLYDCPPEEEEGAGPLMHESRKYSRSLSQISDVSMLLASEEPMKNGCKSDQPPAIGGLGRLTQSVIRLHPLRHQQRENNKVDQQSSTWHGAALYETPDLSWWSDATDASEAPLEDCYCYDTKAHLTDICSSSDPSTAEEAILEYLDLQCDSEEELSISCSKIPMSAGQLGTESDSSLAEIIGNDHLLWHMWQRRQSVAPRGAEDFTDMKTLFATDPDMKLFGSGWDLDPNDSSLGSNEDPMLQDNTRNSSPEAQTGPPMTPNSETRSYVTPTRSSSSSTGYVGRSSSDPKRKSSLIKRFTWGGRHNSPQAPLSYVPKLDQRRMEVKRRKTIEEYETMDREVSNESNDSSDMLF